MLIILTRRNNNRRVNWSTILLSHSYTDAGEEVNSSPPMQEFPQDRTYNLSLQTLYLHCISHNHHYHLLYSRHGLYSLLHHFRKILT